jgi:cytoskeletal protein RodZ
MKRFCFERSTFAALVIFFATFASSQVPSVNPAPGQSDSNVGPQLIAWSALQKPQPVPQQPQPIPPPDQSQPSSQSQSQTPPDQSTQSNPQQPEPETQQTTSQSISGTIAKVNNKYVLQTSDSVTYQLDDQSTAGQYVGKHVKVMGTLDRATGTIRVRSIELLS